MLLHEVGDDSIDLTVTSPPYDNMRTYNGNIDQWSYEKFTKIADELYRVTKPGGCIVWIVGDETIKGTETGSSFRQALYFKSIGFNIHDTMIWIKTGGGAVGSNLCYRQGFEYMFIFSKGRPKSVNLIRDHINQRGGIEMTLSERRNKDGKVKTNGGKKGIIPLTSKRDNWWIVSRNAVNYGHPAVFPLSLAKDHIISWSNPGDTILDPFMGSGTTAVACKELGRQFIGMEIDEEYYNIAKSRIEKADGSGAMGGVLND